jgi:hypothetical protein
LTFEVGDFVYLKVSIMRGLRRFKIRGKLAATWEREEELKAEFPSSSLLSHPNLVGEIPFKRGRFITPRKFTFEEKLKSFYKS